MPIDPDEKAISPEQERRMRPELAASAHKLHEALKQMWAREEMEKQLVYEIKIPSQELTVYGKDSALYALNRLKEIGIKGTYRITEK